MLHHCFSFYIHQGFKQIISINPALILFAKSSSVSALVSVELNSPYYRISLTYLIYSDIN